MQSIPMNSYIYIYIYLHDQKTNRHIRLFDCLIPAMASSLSLRLLMFLLPYFVMALGSQPMSKKPVPEMTSEAADELSFTYYEKTCPNMEAIVHRKVSKWIKEDYTLAASLIRLHFHDCAVRVYFIILHIYNLFFISLNINIGKVIYIYTGM